MWDSVVLQKLEESNSRRENWTIVLNTSLSSLREKVY